MTAKAMANMCALLGVAVVVLLSLSVAGQNSDGGVAGRADAETTVIVVTNRSWTIQQLDEVAIAYLRDSGRMTTNVTTHTMVHIYPHNPTNMCQLTFSSGFNKPFWRVAIDYDGKVVKVDQGIKNEGVMGMKYWGDKTNHSR